MDYKLKVLLATILVIGVVDHCTAQCNVCQLTSKAACISEDQFYPCVNGFPNYSTINRCPTGQICENVLGVCASAATGTPTCAICNTCNGLNTFTCVTYNTYAPCNAGAVVPFIITCPAGWICNPGGTNANPCTTSTWSQIARCPLGQPGSGTTPAPTTVVPSSWCATQISVGNYANPGDSTCKTYLKCFTYNGVRTGQQYRCPGSTLFNPIVRQCQPTYVCA